MKLKNWNFTIALAIVGVFSGCTSKQGSALEMTNVVDDCVAVLAKNNLNTNVCQLVQDNQIIFLADLDESMKYSYTMYNSSNAAVLQMAAVYTLKKGDNHFAIAYPSKISNYEGSSVHTAQEFFEQCDVHIGDFVMLKTNPCDLHTSNKKIGQIGIVTFKEEPKDLKTYNANKVIHYLKHEDRYIEELKFTRFGILGGQ